MPELVGLGFCAIDILVSSHQPLGWEQSNPLNGLAIEGGGPVATALVAAQRLGHSCGFIGTFGSDRLGRIKRGLMEEEGIDLSRSPQRDGPETQAILVLVNSNSGERLFSSVSTPEHSAARRHDALRVEELDRAYITSGRMLHLDGHHPEAAQAAADWMRAEGKPVMLDGSATRGPINPAMRRLVESCDILICGNGFGPALTGEFDLWEAGRRILELGPQVVVQTEGKAGSYTVTRTETFHTPTFEVEVVDTTGAGDVFHGAFASAWLRGWNVRDAVVFSTAVAAIKCRKLGGRPGIPGFDETMRFLTERGAVLDSI